MPFDLATVLIPPPAKAATASAGATTRGTGATGGGAGGFGHLLNQVLANSNSADAVPTGANAGGLGLASRAKGFVGKIASAADASDPVGDKLEPSSQASGDALTAASLQGVTQGFLALAPQAVASSASAALPDGLDASVRDVLQASAGGGGDPAALKTQAGALLQRLDTAEARLTGIDPKAPPQGWTEPQAFAQARSALNALVGGATVAGTPGGMALTPGVNDPATAETLAALNSAPLAARGSAQTQPTQTQPNQAQAAQTQPAQTQPAQTQAIQAQAAQTQAAQTQAAQTQAAQTQAQVQTAAAAAAQVGSPAAAAAAVQIVGPSSPKPAPRLADLAEASAGRSDGGSDSALPAPATSPAKAAASAQVAAAAPAPADAQVTATGALAGADPRDRAAADDAKNASGDAIAAKPADGAQAQGSSSAVQIAYAQGAEINAAAAQAAVRGNPEATAYLAAQLIKRLDGQSSRFEMQLHPADLGRVDVQMRIEQDGRLNAQMAFDNPVAAADFRAHADVLRRQLEQAGFQLSDSSLTFSDRSAQGFNQPQGQGSAQGGGQGWGRSGAQQDASLASASTLVQGQSATAHPSNTSSSRVQLGLDLKV